MTNFQTKYFADFDPLSILTVFSQRKKNTLRNLIFVPFREI